MDTKGFEKKPWFPYLKNMYDEIGGDMMEVDAKGYEEKPWWPYVLDLQEKIDAGGGGGGSSDFSTAEVTIVNNSTVNITTIAYEADVTLENPSPTGYTIPESETYTAIKEGTSTVGEPIEVVLPNYVGGHAWFETISLVTTGGLVGIIEGNCVLSGNLAWEDGALVVTGDGVISYTGLQ